jgi:hypothetical protein
LAPTLPDKDFSGVFSDVAFSEDSPPAEVPPAAPLPEEADPLFSSEDPSPLDSPPPVVLDEDPSPVVGVVDALVVVDVEVVSVASFSAEVLFGGVISGVLFGVTSETLLPPHELIPKPERSISALAPSATRPERCDVLGWSVLTRQTGS